MSDKIKANTKSAEQAHPVEKGHTKTTSLTAMQRAPQFDRYWLVYTVNVTEGENILAGVHS